MYSFFFSFSFFENSKDSPIYNQTIAILDTALTSPMCISQAQTEELRKVVNTLQAKFLLTST